MRRPRFTPPLWLGGGTPPPSKASALKPVLVLSQITKILHVLAQLPPVVIDLARRLERAGVESLLARDLRARLN